ncbi:hypothetical protein [Lysobacter sp. A289]
MRAIVSIAIGIAAWLLLDWLVFRQSDTVRVLPLQVIHFLKVVQPNFLGALLHIVPWMLTGLIAVRRPVLCGAVAAAIASCINSAELVAHVPDGYLTQLFVSSLALATVWSLYGAAGAALGNAMSGSNNSFKPNPLRGPA